MLSGTFDLFPLAEVLGLVERAAASGALVVRGRDVDGTLFFAAGEFSGGEVADLSGPVEDLAALEVRILEVCVALLQTRQAEFEFKAEVTPAWPAALTAPVAPVLERAVGVAREWPSIMSAVESFESMLERTGVITTDSLTLNPTGFRVLEMVDGHTTIRELARQVQASLIVVAPQVRSLILAGAVRVLVDPDRALAAARAGAIGDSAAGNGWMVDVTDARVDPTVVPAGSGSSDRTRPRSEPQPEPQPVGVSATAATPDPVPERTSPATDPAELARERADLAARAGLATPGPFPEAGPAPGDDGAQPERSQIVVDRSDLLRMFSGLKDD